MAAVLLIALALGWLGGVGLGVAVGAPTGVAATIAAAFVLIGLLWWYMRWLRLLCLALAAAGLGMVRAVDARPILGAADVAHYVDREVALEGVVAEDPDRRPAGLLFRLAADRLATAEGEIAVRGDVLVQGSFPARFGDRLVVAGRLMRPADSDELPYARFLAGQDIFALMRDARMVEQRGNEGWPPLVALYDGRARMSGALLRLLPEPQAGLARGMLLGERAALADDLRDAFARTATAHVVAISGYNVSLVAGALLLLGRPRRTRWLGVGLAVLGVGIFVLLVGPTAASVQRAAAMGVLALVARGLHRDADALVGLGVAAVLMTLQRPIVVADLGFQLSFLATLSLISFAPWLERALAGLPGWLRTPLAGTMAAELAVMPLLVATFRQLSVVGLLANLLVLWAVPPAMLTGALAATLGVISPAVATPIGWLAWLFFGWIVVAVEWCAALPFAILEVGPVAGPVVAAYYLALGLLWLTSPGSPFPNPLPALGARLAAHLGRFPARLALVSLACAAAVALGGALSAGGELRADALEGPDAALVRTADGRNALLVGPRASDAAAALGRTLPFWSRRLDIIIVLGPNASTAPGLGAILERYEVGAILAPPGLLRPDNGAPAGSGDDVTDAGERGAALREVAAPRGIPLIAADPDQTFDLRDGASLRLLVDAPGAAAIGALLTRGEQGVLFLGPLEPPAQERLARQVGSPVRVVTLPLTTLADGLAPALLDALRPEAIVATSPSAPLRPVGGPRPPSGARLYLTRDRGAVTITFPSGELRLTAVR